jgi:hypothetical protein
MTSTSHLDKDAKLTTMPQYSPAVYGESSGPLRMKWHSRMLLSLAGGNR